MDKLDHVMGSGVDLLHYLPLAHFEVRFAHRLEYGMDEHDVAQKVERVELVSRKKQVPLSIKVRVIEGHFESHQIVPRRFHMLNCLSRTAKVSGTKRFGLPNIQVGKTKPVPLGVLRQVVLWEPECEVYQSLWTSLSTGSPVHQRVPYPLFP